MRSLLLFFILFTSSASFAEIKIQSISGASRIFGFSSGGANTGIRILGGLAGLESDCASKDNVTTCNNCVDDYAKVCNERRVYNTLELSFTFASTTLAIGTPKITVQQSGTTDFPVTLVTPLPPTTTMNQPVTVAVRWSDLISAAGTAAGAATDCGKTSPPCVVTLRVGLDSSSDNLMIGSDDSTTVSLTIFDPPAAFSTLDRSGAISSCTGGLCNYSLFPGDEKATIEQVTLQDPPNGRPIESLLFLCVEGTDFSLIPSYGPGLKRVPVVGGQPTKDEIEGFTNLVQYSCRSAIEDDTGNIGYFANPADPAQDLVCPPDDTSDSCHQVRPDAVVGLFKEKQNCFIATAAYGSAWMPEVKTLRKFRSEYLYKFAWGRAFTHWYYRNAPPVAQWISESPNRRFGARVILAPIFAAAYLAVHWPMATLSFLIGLVFVFFFRRFYTLRTR